MIKQKIMKLISENADECPYDTADLIDRVANDRILSAGQSRWIETLLRSVKPVGAPPGSKNRSRGNETRLVVECTLREKAGWVRAAGSGKLADWVRDTLNREAE